MSENWKRACQLIVGIEKGKTDALDFSEFRIVFSVGQALVGQPGTAEVYVYNLLSHLTTGVRSGSDTSGPPEQ